MISVSSNLLYFQLKKKDRSTARTEHMYEMIETDPHNCYISMIVLAQSRTSRTGGVSRKYNVSRAQSRKIDTKIINNISF